MDVPNDSGDQPENAGAFTYMSEVYPALRRVAASKLAGAAPEQSLEATGLVHEAYLRLERADRSSWKSRDHFFAAAAETMRCVLVDRARSRLRLKRGAGVRPEPLETGSLRAEGPDEKVLQIHEALERLGMEDEEAAKIVKLSYFMGLTHAEIAEVIGVSEKTVDRRWSVARNRLFQLSQELE